MSEQIFFIAVPTSVQAVKIVYGVGVSPETAIDDAFACCSSNPHESRTYDAVRVRQER